MSDIDTIIAFYVQSWKDNPADFPMFLDEFLKATPEELEEMKAGLEVNNAK